MSWRRPWFLRDMDSVGKDNHARALLQCIMISKKHQTKMLLSKVNIIYLRHMV